MEPRDPARPPEDPLGPPPGDPVGPPPGDPLGPPPGDPVVPPPAATAPPPVAPAPTGPGATAGAKPDHLKRFLAKLIDGFVAAFIFWIVVAIIPGWFTAAMLGALLAAGYWIVCDGLEVDFMRHRSLGKKLLGLTVVRADGRPMDIEASARRNWMFAIGYFTQPFGLALGMLISLAALAILIYEIYKVLTEPDAHRWGDELAGTRVFQG